MKEDASKPSDADRVRDMYDATAESYAEMMDSEIDLPMYGDILGRLQIRITDLPGGLVDTSCGSGHMLARYRERYERDRSLVGIDLSPRMVAIANERLGPAAEVMVGDMRDLSAVASGVAAAVLSFFAVHHLDRGGLAVALAEWRRVLRPGGQLLLAAWEGAGAVDYGDSADIVALRYGADELSSAVRTAGFIVDRCVVEPVEGFPMDAVYLDATVS